MTDGRSMIVRAQCFLCCHASTKEVRKLKKLNFSLGAKRGFVQNLSAKVGFSRKLIGLVKWVSG